LGERLEINIAQVSDTKLQRHQALIVPGGTKTVTSMSSKLNEQHLRAESFFYEAVSYKNHINNDMKSTCS